MIARARDGVPGCMGRDRAVRHSRHRGVAGGLSRLRHQEDELPLLGRAAGQERARRARRCRASTASSTPTTPCRCPMCSAWGPTTSTRSRATSPSASPRQGDTFLDMAAEAGEDPNDPPKPGEVVYADAAKVLCRRWNWRQDARTHHHAGDPPGRGDAAGQRRRRRRDRGGRSRRAAGAACSAPRQPSRSPMPAARA